MWRKWILPWRWHQNIIRYCTSRNTWASMHTVEMCATITKVHLVSLWPWPLTSDLENVFHNTHMMIICGKFHWNLSTKYRDTNIVSREKFSGPCCDHDLCPMTLKTSVGMASHMMVTCAKLCWNPSTKFRDIASRKKFSGPCCDFYLWPMTSKNFSAMAIHMMIIQFHWNPFTKWRYITSCR